MVWSEDRLEGRKRMNDAERQIGRIKAIMEASEDVITRAKEYGNTGAITVAIETAYERVKGIIDDPGYNPWQE